VSALLREFPEAFETERLLIRAPRYGDGPELNAAVCESLAELRPWMEWAQEPPSPEASEENVRKARLRFLERSDLRLQFHLKGAGTLVGCGGLHNITWEIPKFETGYWVRTCFQRQGYVTEALSGITRFAFDVLAARRVALRCSVHNARSRAVAERAGYRLEGLLRNDSLTPQGELRSTLLFSLTPEEYAALSLPPIRRCG
jgi:RimJ/RimL family protein N-acetyltransferase